MPNYNTGTWRIYLITNKLDGKVYVGQTVKKLDKRWSEHVNATLRGSEFYLHRAIRSHSLDSFEMTLLADDIKTLAEANEAEIKFVAQYESFGPKGYNMTRGGDGVVGNIPTEVTRKRMSDAAKLRAPISEETRRKKSEALKGRKKSPETIARMKAAAHKGVDHHMFGKSPPNKGVKATPEEVETNRARIKAILSTPEARAWNSFAQKAVFARKRIAKGKALPGDAELVQQFELRRSQRNAPT